MPNGKEEEPIRPVVPPPPQEEEFFPGFKLEATDIAQSRYRAQKRVTEAGQALSKLQSRITAAFPIVPRAPGAWRIPLLPFLALDVMSQEEFDRQRATAQAELDEATQEFNRFSWRQQVLFGLPYMLLDPQSGVRSTDDLIGALPNQFLDDLDREWLNNTWSRLEHLVLPEFPPEYKGTPEEIRTQLLTDILAAPKLEMRGVHHLTVDELIKSFQVSPAELPPGMDTEAVRGILKDLEFDEETQKEIEDIHNLTEELMEDWREQVAYMELLRTGLEQVEPPELTPMEFFKMMATQPALAALELLEKYFMMLPRPLVALAIINFPRLRKDSDAAELERLYNQYRELGEGWWGAASVAFRDWGTNIWLKMFVETMFDPTTYIGLGIATRLVKPVPYVGRFVGAFERGWLELWDVPFRGARNLIKQIPKTPGQHAISYARQAFLDSRAFLRRTLGKDIGTVSKAEMDDAFRLAVQQSVDMPYEMGNQAVRVGRYLTEYDFFEEAAIRELYSNAKVTADVTPQLVQDFNAGFDMFFRKTKTAKELASELLVHAGTEPTGEVLSRFVSLLEHRKARIITGATDIARGNSAKEVLESVLRNVEEMQLRKTASPVYKYAMQSGRATSWMSRGVDKFVRNGLVAWMDRHVTAPMANQYLLFTNYGPFNVLESSIRSFLGGGEVFYPRASSPVDEVVRIGEGLSSFPFEFTQFQRQLGRLEIAVVDPKTGKTMVFEKGRIPGITRELPEAITKRLPEVEIPLPAGVAIEFPRGVRIRIGTKDYQIRSWQHWNDMFGDIGSQQRAWYYLTKYKQKLWETAPDEMAQLAKAFDNSAPLLDDIGVFTKREKEDILRVLQQDATVGPDVIRKHDVPMLELERRRAHYEINKVLDRCTDIYSVQKNTIRHEVLDGTMWKAGVDERIAAVKESIREFNVLGLQAEGDALTQLTKDMAEFVPENADDILRTMGFISDITEAVSDRVSDVRMITRARAAKLTQKEADDFHLASSESLAEFLGKSQSEVDGILDNLVKSITDKGLLDVDQLAVLERLSTAIKMRNANALSTRDLDRKIINDAIATTPKNKRDRAFWDFLENKRRTEAWDTYWTREEQLFEVVEDVKNRLMVGLGVTPDAPMAVPEVVDRLVPAHVAYLLGVTGDDLNKALTKVGAMVTIRPKNKFVAWVYSRAKRTAGNVGKTPEDIGFSKEAIGDVYDQMFANLGFDPKAVADEPLTPAMSQLEEVRQELHRIKGTSAIPDDDYLKYKNYINRVADDLGELPMYKAEKIPATGEEIASAIGVKFDGMQKMPKKAQAEFGVEAFTFTDPESGSTFLAKDFAQARTELIGVRKDFGLPEPVIPERPPVEAWWAKKESAMMKTRQAYEVDFTDYENRNMVDAAMRMVFPFWTYEWQRWFWLPRTFLKTPGTATGLGRYMDYSDQGYIPLPGTDMQFNPLRGTVFMGGFRRMYLRDFPEYYDAFPGMEMIDYISRLGFYPGIHVMLPIVAFGAFTGKPEWGEIAPAWAKTGLNAARAVAPEQAGKVIDHIFPDRFRDYLTMLTLAEQGEDADAIWRKKEQNLKLTEEEEKLWLRAEAKATGLKGILMEQTGVFRLRPKEYTQMMQDMNELIAEMTGVPVSVQETIRRRQAVTGKRFSDYFKLDSLQQKIIYEAEAYRRWQGVTTPLYPSTWQHEDIRVRDYFEKVDDLFNDARREGIYDEEGNLTQSSVDDLTRQWVSGEIGPRQWVSGRGDVLSYASAASTEMGKRDYPDVPKTLDEREARFKERGIPAPTYSPDQELMYKYFDIKPEYKWDWEQERMTYDFDAYYAKIDAMIDTLRGEFRQRFIDRVQFDWNPMERLYWQISREYMRPYRLVRNLVLEQYTEEQQQLITRYEVARGAERDEIRETTGPEGRKLISHFTSSLREARQRLRLLDPTLDAWVYFFGTTDTLMTTESGQIYNDLVRQYMNPKMLR